MRLWSVESKQPRVTVQLSDTSDPGKRLEVARLLGVHQRISDELAVARKQRVAIYRRMYWIDGLFVYGIASLGLAFLLNVANQHYPFALPGYVTGALSIPGGVALVIGAVLHGEGGGTDSATRLNSFAYRVDGMLEEVNREIKRLESELSKCERQLAEQE